MTLLGVGAPSATADPTTTSPPPSSASGEVRLGCGSYCQNAGGYGGGGTGLPAVTIVSTGTVTADADGYVPVTLTCNLPVQCRGRLSVYSQAETTDPATGNAIHPTLGGQSDLLVDRGATRTFGIPLGAGAIAFLRSHGPATVDVTADNGLVPLCDQIPQPAGCVEMTQPPNWDFVIRAQLMVAAPG
jgi:hypothetical protein